MKKHIKVVREKKKPRQYDAYGNKNIKMSNKKKGLLC